MKNHPTFIVLVESGLFDELLSTTEALALK